MKLYFGDRFDRTNALVAGGVWFLILVIYSLTKAPTVSFWDCGEFIACAKILGIPHPPGTPMYVMVSRLFILNPFIEDIAARINWLSSLTSSVAALFCYLSAVRILRGWLGDPTDRLGRFIMFAGAAAGALFLAFNLTQWSNSVEAEVYGFSMALLSAIFWLTLVYHQLPESRSAYQIMLLVVYLSFMGIGVHMTTFLILPVAAVFFVIRKGAPTKIWFLMAAFVVAEFYLIFLLSSRPHEISPFFPAIVAVVFYLFYALSFERVPTRLLGLAGMLCLTGAAVLEPVFPAYKTILLAISFAGLAAANGFGIWLLLNFARTRKAGGTADHSWTIPALFVLVVDVLALMHLSTLHGYHAFVVITILLALGLGFLIRQWINWPVLIVLAGSSLVIIGVYYFVYGAIGAAALVLLIGLVRRSPAWIIAALIAVFAVLGYSQHLFIPIRSNCEPYINENDPGQSIAATVGYLERKQYGSEGMVERMFERRAEWANQFGTYRRMGMWGFFHKEYGLPGGKFAIVLLLGLVGMWESIRRKPEMGLFLSLLIIVGSVGLVLYMNFADGTRYDPAGYTNDYLEVRDRDYFFTPAFMFFGLAIGIGMAAVIQMIREMTSKMSAAPRMAIPAAVSLIFLLPAVTIAKNWKESDRTGNYIPYDYAWNLLQSCDANAVFFTAGDNDTFPLWALQEAFGIRKDVRIVNLSLANTKWYIRQVRDYMGLKLNMTDQEIEDMVPYRTPDGKTFRIQDQLMDAIIANNASTVPINYSITVDMPSRRYYSAQIDSLLILRGAAFRLRGTRGPSVDLAGTTDLLEHRFQFRGLNDPNVFKDEFTLRTVGNIPQIFLVVADSLQQAGQKEQALHYAEEALKYFPFSSDALNGLTTRYSDLGMIKELKALVDKPYIDNKRVQVAIGRTYRKQGNKAEAESILKTILTENPTYRPALDELMRMYIQLNDRAMMVATLRVWVQNNPTDSQMLQVIKQIEAADKPAPADSGHKP